MVVKRRQKRHVGDTEIPIAATLERPDGNAVSLADKTVSFYMVDADGEDVVAETTSNVEVTNEDDGECRYNPQAADVDTAGTYYAYFVVTDADGNRDTFPVGQQEFEIVIEGD